MHVLARFWAQFSGKACQCMRSARGFSSAIAIVSLFVAGPALADLSDAVSIPQAARSLISVSANFWHEQAAKMTIEQASQPSAAAQFTPLQRETLFALKPQDRLWIRLDMERKSDAPDHLILWIPLPLLDSATLYQKTSDGTWKRSSAGDRISVASWPEPGRYPRFHLELPSGKSSIYLQVQGSTPISIPLNIGTEVAAQAADREGFLGMGVIVGLLLTLVVMCLVTAYTYKDRLYLLYGFYVLLMILAVGAYTGLAAYLIWDHSPIWADASQGALALLSAGGALYFIEALLAGRQYMKRFSSTLWVLCALALPLSAIYCVVPRQVGVVILGVYMIVITTIGLTLASRAWSRGDRVGMWVFIAYFPLALAVLLAIARAYGWVGVSWVAQYGVVIALLIEAPLMMAALHLRSKERHEIATREQALSTHDALTGLLTEYIFDDRLKQTMARSAKHREDAAVVLISLVNYQSIAQAYGLPVAEQSVLRAVIKLRKVVPDIETVARVGTSHFGLIIEGANRRASITDIGARLIAQGLMPLPGLIPEVTLQFHLAAVVLREVPGTDQDIKGSLYGLLMGMSPRTRRPIRFLEAASTGGTPLAPANPPSQVDLLTEQVNALASKPDWQRIESRPAEPNSSGGLSSVSSLGHEEMLPPR
jgi:two-component system, sensor histidine kinase LadS